LSPPQDYGSKAADAFLTVKGGDVVRTFLVAAEAHGAPAVLLTDNGAVFTRGPRHPRSSSSSGKGSLTGMW